MSNAHPGRIVPQDVVPQDGDDMLTSMPISQSEVEELLYGEDRPAAERIARLQELAGQLRDKESADFGDDDPHVLLGEIDAAIASLSGGLDAEAEPDLREAAIDDDPLNHRETLSPDSDELDDIDEDDEASLTDGSEPLDDDVLDPEEWDDGDGFDVDRGVK